jgi:hypothetical protein
MGLSLSERSEIPKQLRIFQTRNIVAAINDFAIAAIGDLNQGYAMRILYHLSFTCHYDTASEYRDLPLDLKNSLKNSYS